MKKEMRKNHICDKNWKGPSTSMEAALIVEGFGEIEKKGARIMQYIGNQDSSVLKSIVRHFEWGSRVTKVDCINRKIRNFTTYIINWKKKHHLEIIFLERMIQHYKALIRKLINEKSVDKNYFLKHLPNTLDHIIGKHDHCDNFYCHTNYVFPLLQISTDAYNELKEYLTKLLQNPIDCEKELPTIWQRLFLVVCKFDHGKIKNFIQGNNYRLRSLCTVLSFNEGPLWNYDIIKKYIGEGSVVKDNFFDYKNYMFEKGKKWRQSDYYKNKRKSKKFDKIKSDDNGGYGIYADEEDNPDDIWESCMEYFTKRVVVEVKNSILIEQNTQDQSDNIRWYQYRMKRLTASRFGDICKTHSDNRKINIVKELINS